MAILQNRRTVFSLSNSEVMSNSAPTTEAGITKSEGHDGFFIYSDKAFTLWFKDQGGSWSSYNTYNLVDLEDGVAFSWGTNTAAFVQTGEALHSIAVFVIETKDVSQYKNIENKTLNEVGYNRLDVHSNYKRVRMQNSGHTGEAYAIAIFDDNGDAAYVSAPPSGQREGKVLGWDENGDLGWVSLTPPAASVTPPDLYFDGSSTSSQVGSKTVAFTGASAGLTTSLGKYGSDAFTFGTSGGNSMALSSVINLSTGIYTFSAWFYNLRADTTTGDMKALIKKSGQGLLNAHYPIYIHNNQELGVYRNGGGDFTSTGYSMAHLEGDQQWTHIAVVADGTNSTFYINGVQAGNSIAKVITQSVARIGGYGHGDQTWSEAIDELAYWGSTLTAEQIATIYNSSDKLSVLAPVPPVTPSIPSAPNLYFDGSSTSSQIGSNSVTFNGASAALTTSLGKYDSNAFTFGTSGGNSMSLSSVISLSTGVYTFSAWFYNLRADTSTGDMKALIKKSGQGLANAHYPIYIHNNQELGIYRHGSGAFTSTGYSTAHLEGDQQWTHVAVVADGTNSTFYINGVQAGNVIAKVITQNVSVIGGYSHGDQTWSEAIDELAYWDSALTEGEILGIYNSSDKLSEIV